MQQRARYIFLSAASLK